MGKGIYGVGRGHAKIIMVMHGHLQTITSQQFHQLSNHGRVGNAHRIGNAYRKSAGLSGDGASSTRKP